MMLLFLDREPVECARKLARTMGVAYAFKQLIELCQLICSAGISDVYKRVPQGKKLQAWVKQYPEWTFLFMEQLIRMVESKVAIKPSTMVSLIKIKKDLEKVCNEDNFIAPSYGISKVIFRYKKEYTGTYYETDSELLPSQAIEEYNRYLRWKVQKLMEKSYRKVEE